MNFSHLINEINFSSKEIYIETKIIRLKLKKKWSKIFNKTCLTKGILPNYTRIKIFSEN